MSPSCRPQTAQLVLVALFALCVCARPDSDKLHSLLRNAPLAPDKHQDLSLLSSLLLAELFSLENDSLQDPEPASVHERSEGVHEDRGEGVHEEPAGVHVAREALLLAPRERKAGCKNFFWKTFTSC